jgi:uroporphyrinogen-III synthase
MAKTDMKDRPLAGRRVLVTRPAHQSDAIQARLTHLGAHCIPLPLLDIKPVCEGDDRFVLIKHQIMNLDLYRMVICISPNAARIALDWIDQYWPQLPVGIDWFAIGKTTQAILAEVGIEASCSAKGFDSQAMLDMPHLEGVEGSKILILRGQGGRPTLEEGLSGRGASVEYANLYDRVCPDYDDSIIESRIYQSAPDSILITSGEALSNFVTVAKGSKNQFSINPLLNCTLVVPSKRIAELAKQQGFTKIMVAEGPADIAMANALQHNDSEANE